MPAGNCRGLFETGVLVRDEVGNKRHVLPALHNRSRPRHRMARLHSGHPAEPRQLDLSVLEHLDRGLVVGRGDELDSQAKLLPEMERHGVELGLKFGGILVRNRGKPQHLRRRASARSASGRRIGRLAPPVTVRKREEGSQENEWIESGHWDSWSNGFWTEHASEPGESRRHLSHAPSKSHPARCHAKNQI